MEDATNVTQGASAPDAKTLANDLSAHLVYGLGTAAALRALSR